MDWRSTRLIHSNGDTNNRGRKTMSKCSGCDQHNAVIYDDEDMYCHDCYNEKREIVDDWFLSDKSYEEYYNE